LPPVVDPVVPPVVEVVVAASEVPPSRAPPVVEVPVVEAPVVALETSGPASPAVVVEAEVAFAIALDDDDCPVEEPALVGVGEPEVPPLAASPVPPLLARPPPDEVGPPELPPPAVVEVPTSPLIAPLHATLKAAMQIPPAHTPPVRGVLDRLLMFIVPDSD
jgi:hypothetical protein